MPTKLTLWANDPVPSRFPENEWQGRDNNDGVLYLVNFVNPKVHNPHPCSICNKVFMGDSIQVTLQVQQIDCRAGAIYRPGVYIERTTVVCPECYPKRLRGKYFSLPTDHPIHLDAIRPYSDLGL